MLFKLRVLAHFEKLSVLLLFLPIEIIGDPSTCAVPALKLLTSETIPMVIACVYSSFPESFFLAVGTE
jgi:hypothetical protein